MEISTVQCKACRSASTVIKRSEYGHYKECMFCGTLGMLPEAEPVEPKPVPSNPVEPLTWCGMCFEHPKNCTCKTTLALFIGTIVIGVLSVIIGSFFL